MSDTRDPRGRAASIPKPSVAPAVPRARPYAGAPSKALSPSPPRVATVPPPVPAAPKAQTPEPPAVTARAIVQIGPGSEPPASGWDDPDSTAVTHRPDLARQTASEARPTEAKPASDDRSRETPSRRPYDTSPGMGAAAAATRTAPPSLTREEIASLVRSVVEEALAPLIVRHAELEARIGRTEAALDVRLRHAESSLDSRLRQAEEAFETAVARVSLIPVHVSAPPPPMTPNLASEPQARGEARPAPSMAPPMPVAPFAQGGSELAARPDAGRLPAPPRVVAPPPALTFDLDAVGPIDIEGFDGGRRKRRVAATFITLLLLVVVGLVTATILSHR